MHLQDNFLLCFVFYDKIKDGGSNFFHLCQNELRIDMFLNPCLITTIKKSMQMCFAISCRLQLKKKKYC